MAGSESAREAFTSVSMGAIVAAPSVMMGSRGNSYPNEFPGGRSVTAVASIRGSANERVGRFPAGVGSSLSTHHVSLLIWQGQRPHPGRPAQHTRLGGDRRTSQL